MRIWLALPAYNEEQGLAALLPRFAAAVRENGWSPYAVVVDDGSTDGTVDVAIKQGFQVTVVWHLENQGLGRTLIDAIRMALRYAADRDVIVTMDADDTHPVELIPQMVRRIQDGYDVVIASRYRRGADVVGLSWRRKLLSFGARALFQVIAPMRGVRDYTCGFRAYSPKFLRGALRKDFRESGFAITAELLLSLRNARPRICEVPMTLRYDRKHGASKNNLWRTIRATLRVAWNA